MQASRRVLVLVMIVLLALAGCSSESADDGSDDNGDETPAATEPAEQEETEEPDTDEQQEATATPEDEAEATETPDDEADGTSSERRIEPNELQLVSESGEQSGQIGPYFWTNETLELAAEVGGGYYERQEEPLEVAQGDEVTIETPADDFPTSIALEIFPPTEPNENGLVQMEAEPESTQELDPEDPVWTVELEPGDHYVQVQTVWPTNEVWERDREVTYRFWVSVSE